MVGKRYRLTRPLRAVHADGGKGFVLLPEGAVLIVHAEHDSRRILEIDWETQQLFVFTQDILERGREYEQ